MQFLKLIFSPIVAIFKFINTYFKTCVFLLIVFLLLANTNPKIPNLAQIDLKDVIGENTLILEQIYKLKEDESIKGVLLNIDSPGGSLSASVELSEAIKELSEIKPVLAYASGTMASGSYYAAIWADKIYANKGSFIGSIGVIIQGANLEELANKIGIKEQVVKAGEYKEAGTVMREWSELERKQLQDLANQSYEMFYADVAKARNIDIKTKDKWANARVFLAKDALKFGLIDGVSSYFGARDELAVLARVDEPIWRETPVMQRFLNEISKTSSNLIFQSILGLNIK